MTSFRELEPGSNIPPVVIPPGKSADLGFDGEKRYFEILQGEVLVRYGEVHGIEGERRITWESSPVGMDVVSVGAFLGAGGGRVLTLMNRSPLNAIVKEIRTT
jgi:hypothetical protein